MLDFRSVRNKSQSLLGLADGLTKADLVAATHALLDDVLTRMADATDADITFPPADPMANDQFAADSAEVGIAWTLGHVVVHLTASAEEAAFISAELARGVVREGRSRDETPWLTVTTAAGARARIDESRRMLLAMLAVWPDQPHLDVVMPGASGPRNAVARFLSGLSHADSHLEQISDIVTQVKSARGESAWHPGRQRGSPARSAGA